MHPILREELNKRIRRGGLATDIDLHVHTCLSDGNNTAEEMILSAIDRGIKVLGFSEHSQVPGEEWCMNEARETEYRHIITELKEKYKDQIMIFCGIEQEGISGRADPFYDFVLGSAHAVKAGDGIMWADCSGEVVEEAVNRYYGGDYYAYAEAYFANAGRIDEITGCDIIGHFDLLTKFNENNEMFDLSHPRYVKAWKDAADRLSGKNLIFEINTGAISRGYRSRPYPASDIIRYLYGKGEALILCSDSHDVSAIGFQFDKWSRELSGIIRTPGPGHWNK